MGADRRSLKILYAEDMLELREFMVTVLERAGHLVETAADGEEAVAHLKKPGAVFDLLVTDHQMPRMTGLELVRQLKGFSFTGKIVVFASELSPPIQEEYLRHGANLILTKPTSATTLCESVEQLFAIS